MRSQRQRCTCALTVSIRARHCWRAMHAVGHVADGLGQFQSAPAIAGGRCLTLPCSGEITNGFNPRPPLLAGDAPEIVPASLTQDVSIRARHCWRAMRLRHAQPGDPARGFNPRPPLLAGDALRTRWRLDACEVSIRARHCWRAMLLPLVISRSRPMFQSAPAIAGGRCGLDLRVDALSEVSIRARHCWRAMPSGVAGVGVKQQFQSAPAIAGGRCTHRQARWARRRCFNPRPPLLAGDAAPPGAKHHEQLVSIRARHCWRAMRSVMFSRCRTSQVSIRARHCWRAMPGARCFRCPL